MVVVTQLLAFKMKYDFLSFYTRPSDKKETKSSWVLGHRPAIAPYSNPLTVEPKLQPYFLNPFFGGGAHNKLERLPSQLDSFAIRQVKREGMVSPSGVPSIWSVVAKINGEKGLSC